MSESYIKCGSGSSQPQQRVRVSFHRILYRVLPTIWLTPTSPAPFLTISHPHCTSQPHIMSFGSSTGPSCLVLQSLHICYSLCWECSVQQIPTHLQGPADLFPTQEIIWGVPRPKSGVSPTPTLKSCQNAPLSAVQPGSHQLQLPADWFGSLSF